MEKLRSWAVAIFGCLLLSWGHAHAQAVHYNRATVNGISIFYREAGDPKKPTILLLHGFPSSSVMFRDLIPLLSAQFHLVAPDYPGMGYSDAPTADKFTATFDNLATTVEDFTSVIGLNHFILYMQDFGGPVGMRIAVSHPEQITGLIVQNTPISLSGWDPARLRAVQANAGSVTPEKRAAAEGRVTEATAILLHQHGSAHPEHLNPDAWAADAFALADPEKRRIMTDLQLDIPSNLALYPAWQDYLRTKRPRTLVLWGRNDPIFAAQGAEDVKTANPGAEVHYYETGHFALDEESSAMAGQIARYFHR